MKFLCPQCKAKYRIADEKLAQRATSKMKCRKCGHIIDIKSAAVPESIRAGADTDEDDDDATGAARPVPRVAPKPTGSPQFRGATPPPRRTAPTAQKRTGGLAPPRRSGVVAVARAVAEKEPVEQEAADAQPEPARNEFEEDAPTRIHDGGALSAAFSLAVEQSTGAGAPASPSGPDEWYVGIDGSPIGPLSLQQLKEKARTRKATLESLVWKDGFEEWKPLKDFPELVALVEDGAPAPAAYEPEARTVPAPSPLEEPTREKVPSALSPDVLEELGVKKRKTAVSHPVAWIAVIVAMAFGVTIGIVLFSKTEKQTLVKYVQVQPSAKPAEHETATDAPQMLEESTVSGGGPRRAGGGVQPKPEASVQKTSGSSLLSGLNGPNVGPASGSGNDTAAGGNPGGQLDGASIQKTVANYSPGVRRGCWEIALSSRASDAPTSARVGVTITIAGSGNVENVTTTGDPKGYPNLSRCIESKVRTWRFPRSSGTTTANVPFVFAAQ